MSSRHLKAFDYALRAVRRDAGRHGDAGGAASTRRKGPRERSIVRRELDSFRRGQGLPYWHHDRH
jgi:hypothetical protein